jgi:hypothetical protein
MTCNNQTSQRIIPTDTPKPKFSLYGDELSNKLLNDYSAETFEIGGTIINVYKLLGIHEQKSLTALNGTIISNGEYPEFPMDNLKKNDCQEWRSIKHCGKRSKDTYIGYDFGDIIQDGSKKYAIHTENKYHVTSIFIHQGSNDYNRISSARLENSSDGINYKGISLITFPNDDKEHWIDVKQSFPARYWRIVPTIYNGTENDLWILKKLAFSEYTKTSITNIQDDIFLENRDREYSMDYIPIKAYYNLADITTDFEKFAMPFLNNDYNFKFNFNITINSLKRPIVIGDILEVPCETQYDINMNPIRKWLEVSDVGLDAATYTVGWQFTTYNVIAKPMLSSQETMDIVGDLNNTFNDPMFNTSALKSSDKIKAEYNTMVPEVGANHNDTQEISPDTVLNGLKYGVNLNKLNIDNKSYLVEDGMPPNGLPYTEGSKYPENPSNGDYHRLTYEFLKDPIAPKLFQYSSKKSRWIYLETDKRISSNSKKPFVSEYINGVDASKIGK